MELGVVYDPTRDELFSAQNGQGAKLNGRPIHVGDYSDLIECMLATGFPRDMWETDKDNIGNFIRFSKVAQSVRRMGSAALDIVYVAMGRLEGFWNIQIHQWDVAAASLIVQEAGGVVTNVSGDPDFMQQPVTIVCANPAIHAKMLAVLAEGHAGIKE